VLSRNRRERSLLAYNLTASQLVRVPHDVDCLHHIAFDFERGRLNQTVRSGHVAAAIADHALRLPNRSNETSIFLPRT
jgi:hypothetical protein